jgi:hypothetical protein
VVIAARSWLPVLVVVLLFAQTSAMGGVGRVSPCRLRYPSDSRLDWTCQRLRAGESLELVFGDRWIDVARFNRIDRRHAAPGTEIKVPANLDDIRDFTPLPREYADARTEARFVLVDRSEQFLGAYEAGRLVFSAPVTVGEEDHETPAGDFRITAAHRSHVSSLYTIEGTSTPYPMTWALRFHTSPDGVTFWLHGRDMPGCPASHGCIGLYDEWMQQAYYGVPRVPVLDDARTLYEWVLGARAGDGGIVTLRDGPRLRIIGRAPR